MGDGIGREDPAATVADDHIDILFLTHNFPRYPTDFAGRFLARLAGLIIARDGRVGVLAPHCAGAATDEYLDDIRVWRFRYADDGAETLAYRGDWGGVSLFGAHGLWAHRRFFSAFAEEAQRLISHYAPRVVHAHWWIPAGWVARRCGTGRTLVVTLHGTDLRLLQAKRWLRPLAGRVFASADVITAVSSWLADFVRDMFPQAASKVRVAPMPPEDSIFRSEAQRTVADDPPLIVSVTRFTEQKRNSILVDALARLRDRGMDFRCRLIGSGGAMQESVELRIAARGMEDRIELIGSISQAELAGEYRRADLVVLPAVDEGFGMALVEAQLCGCAVAGVRSGGITDIVTDGENGLLARPDDPADLCDVIGRALADDSLRATLARRGQESAQRKFSSEVIVGKFLSWYAGGKD